MRINNQYCISGIMPQTIQLNFRFFFVTVSFVYSQRSTSSLRGHSTIALRVWYIVQWFTCMHIYSNWNTFYFISLYLYPIDNDIFVIINFLGYCCWRSIYFCCRWFCWNVVYKQPNKKNITNAFTFFQYIALCTFYEVRGRKGGKAACLNFDWNENIIAIIYCMR